MKILFVEDSESLQRSVSTGLRSLGFSVQQALDGRSALRQLADGEFDVVLLDLLLPGLGGLEVLKRMREDGDSASVLILSALDQTEDRVLGLDLGADDYLVKPFSFEELVSRLRALMRRRSGNKQAQLLIEDLRIDSIARRVYYRERELRLTPHEFALLEFLGRRRGTVFSQDQLIGRLYDDSAYVTRNAIEAHVSTLRRKLRAAGLGALIRTRRGFGYIIQ